VTVIVFVPGVRLKVFPVAGAEPSSAAPAASAGPASAAPTPPAPSSPPVYVVVKGDTLWTIAARLTGDPRKFGRLAIENGIADPDRIYPGQEIRLLPK
jgi:nucleoid-associated protein YgaU